MFFFNINELELLDEVQKDSSDCDVEIEGAINTKTTPISQYKVRLAYGDLKLMVAILRDYVKSFDKLKEEGNLTINEIEYECYYRKKFLEIAGRISEQIEYDYDKQMEKCLKKLSKVDNSDIGEEALALAMKR